jgi:predicted nucleotidyltransferase
MTSTLRRDDVIALIRAHREEIDAFGVRSLALFGSVARDEAGPESDIDVLVEFDEPPRFGTYMGLKLLLEDLLGRRVDLADRSALRPRWKPYIEQDAVLVA